MFSFFLLSCTFQEVPGEKKCRSDGDCVPASCCHANDSVNVKFAPDCSEMFCTLECAPETLDCGQGEIKCVEGQCQALLGNN